MCVCVCADGCAFSPCVFESRRTHITLAGTPFFVAMIANQINQNTVTCIPLCVWRCEYVCVCACVCVCVCIEAVTEVHIPTPATQMDTNSFCDAC